MHISFSGDKEELFTRPDKWDQIAPNLYKYVGEDRLALTNTFTDIKRMRELWPNEKVILIQGTSVNHFDFPVMRIQDIHDS